MTTEQLEMQRPSNPTWKELASITSRNDIKADAGASAESIFMESTSYEIEWWIDNVALEEITHMVNAAFQITTEGSKSLSPELLLLSAWIGGMGHGIHDSQGRKLADAEGMLERMYAGVDVESADYIASQRVMRMASALDNAENPEELLVQLVTAYCDGFQTGYIYGKQHEMDV